MAPSLNKALGPFSPNDVDICPVLCDTDNGKWVNTLEMIMHIQICKNCNKEFEVAQDTRNWKNVKICSDKCRAEIATKSKRKRYVPKVVKRKQCEWCEEMFMPRQTIGARQKYCSESCSAKARAYRSSVNWTDDRRTKKCLQCGADFLPKKFCAGQQIYCDDKCRKKAINERHRSRYVRPKHSSNEFKLIRPDVIKRDGGACVLCGDDRRIHVHHLDNSGARDDFNNSIDNLIVLCASCHNAIHSVTLVKINDKWMLEGKIFDLVEIDSPIPINK